MISLTAIRRAAARVRFKVLGLATVTDIPTERFNALVAALVARGWEPESVYSGVDAWIDYGSLHLRKDGVVLKCEWDNWTEGSIEGPRATVEAIAAEADLRVSYQWRWSDHVRSRPDA